jgi:hypothetical protein
LSPALTQLSDAGLPPFPMALVSAITQGGNNLSDLDCLYFCAAYWLKQSCYTDTLAQDLTPTGWYAVFGQYNDAVVPLLSQLNGGTAGPNTPTLAGVMHSPGLESLDFLPPSELDPSSNVPEQVVFLLDEPPNGPDFQPSSGGGQIFYVLGRRRNLQKKTTKGSTARGDLGGRHCSEWDLSCGRSLRS